MNYSKYVENLILESGLDESVELLEILEGAESIGDLEAIEEYLTERFDTNADYERRFQAKKEYEERKSAAKQRLAEKKAAEEEGRRSETAAALKKLQADEAKKKLDTFRSKMAETRDDRKRILADNEARKKMYDKSPTVSNPPAVISNVVSFEEIDSKAAKTRGHFSKGQVGLGAVALIALTAGAATKMRTHLKAVKSAAANNIKEEITDLENEAQDVAQQCKDGKISANEAAACLKKIQTKIKVLAKKVSKIVPKKAVATKESVLTEIYESVAEGEIDITEATELLDLLYESGIDEE